MPYFVSRYFNIYSQLPSFLSTPESHNKLAQSVSNLAEALLGVKHEQEFMEVRERVHRASKSDKIYIYIYISPKYNQFLYV